MLHIGFTAWDKIELKGFKTLKEIIDYIKKTYDVDISIITTKKICFYSRYQQDSNMEKRLG